MEGGGGFQDTLWGRKAKRQRATCRMSALCKEEGKIKSINLLICPEGRRGRARGGSGAGRGGGGGGGEAGTQAPGGEPHSCFTYAEVKIKPKKSLK